MWYAILSKSQKISQLDLPTRKAWHGFKWFGHDVALIPIQQKRVLSNRQWWCKVIAAHPSTWLSCRAQRTILPYFSLEESRKNNSIHTIENNEPIATTETHFLRERESYGWSDWPQRSHFSWLSLLSLWWDNENERVTQYYLERGYHKPSSEGFRECWHTYWFARRTHCSQEALLAGVSLERRKQNNDGHFEHLTGHGTKVAGSTI